MGTVEIIIVVIVALLVAAVLGYLIYKKVKGESVGCDCGSCSGCPRCSSCKPKDKDFSDGKNKNSMQD